MPDAARTQLSLPADARWLRLVQDYGRTLAELADFPEDQAESLALALREAFTNCIQHAFAEDESGTITLVGELTPAALTLAVHDRGLPFDQSLDPAASPSEPKSSSAASRISHGLSLIHQCADEVRWLNHGPEGKELRLTKYRPGLCRLEPRPAPPDRSSLEAAPAKRPQDYAIRLLRPEDAIRVAQLMYRVYGYTYAKVDIYYPERLAHNIKTGTHVGVVAVADDGEIAGHAGLMRPNQGPLGELGQLAVAPLHRGQGLVKRMANRLQEEIQRLGLVGLYSEAVTLHTVGQEASEDQGLHVAGIQLLDLQSHFKGLQISPRDTGSRDHKPELGPQRETVVFYFNYLVPSETTRVCALARHQEILAKIYRNLGVSVEFFQPGPAPATGRLAVHFNQTYGAGVIQVNRIGTDTLPEIHQACRDLCHLAGAAVVFLDLPLAQGGIPDLCDAAEADGFFFAGVRPHFAPDGDFLRLQYLNAEFDPERIHLYSPFARDLLAYILKDKARGEQNLKT